MQSPVGGASGAEGVAAVVSVPVPAPGFVPPRVEKVPPGDPSKGLEAVEFARSVGIHPDAHQEFVLVNSLRSRRDGKWSSFEVGVVEARQNGKGEMLLVRELAGLFLFGEKLITHSAHRVDTALEGFRRLVAVIEDSAELSRRVKKIINVNGREGIELVTGERIRFTSRSTGGGKGFTGDTVIFDEAMFLAESFHGALMPTLSATSVSGNPQAWYTGSAVDQWIHENGVVFARQRERGHGDGSRLAWFEWAADTELLPAEVSRSDLENRQWWVEANPALGERISEEHVASELESMDNRTFAVERLGIGDWPRTDGVVDTVIRVSDWLALVGNGDQAGPVFVAFDVSPSRSTAIAVAFRCTDGLIQVEISDHTRGTSWLPARLSEILARNDVIRVVCDGYGGAGSLVNACRDEGVIVDTTTGTQLAQACGRLVDAVNEKQLRHLGSDELLNALRGSKARPLGDNWAWSRKNSSVDIAPLMACTLAVWAAIEMPQGDGDGLQIW